MLILDGMPGTGITGRMGSLLNRAPQVVVFPALPHLPHHHGETVVRLEFEEDYRRTLVAEHAAEPVVADGGYLGTLARAYVRASTLGEWDTFHSALALTPPLDERHHDDDVLLLHTAPETAFRRRHGARTARPGELDVLRAYARFYEHLDDWVTPGPRWRHVDAGDPDVAKALNALVPPAPAADSLPLSQTDLTCGRSCGHPRSRVVTRGKTRVQLWSQGLHAWRPHSLVRCLRTAAELEGVR